MFCKLEQPRILELLSFLRKERADMHTFNKYFTDQQILQTFFYYKSETGLFYNNKNRYKPIGWLTDKGYLKTEWEGRDYFVHKLIWIYNNGNILEKAEIAIKIARTQYHGEFSNHG